MQSLGECPLLGSLRGTQVEPSVRESRPLCSSYTPGGESGPVVSTVWGKQSRLPKVLGGQGKKEVPEEAWARVDLDRAEREVCMYAGGNPNWRGEKQ